MFYIVCRDLKERSQLIQYLKENGVTAPFHYLSLHKSDYYINNTDCVSQLPYCDMYADCLVRLPLYYELSIEEVNFIVGKIKDFYESR